MQGLPDSSSRAAPGWGPGLPEQARLGTEARALGAYRAGFALLHRWQCIRARRHADRGHRGGAGPGTQGPRQRRAPGPCGQPDQAGSPARSPQTAADPGSASAYLLSDRDPKIPIASPPPRRRTGKKSAVRRPSARRRPAARRPRAKTAQGVGRTRAGQRQVDAGPARVYAPRDPGARLAATRRGGCRPAMDPSHRPTRSRRRRRSQRCTARRPP